MYSFESLSSIHTYKEGKAAYLSCLLVQQNSFKDNKLWTYFHFATPCTSIQTWVKDWAQKNVEFGKRKVEHSLTPCLNCTKIAQCTAR